MVQVQKPCSYAPVSQSTDLTVKLVNPIAKKVNFVLTYLYAESGRFCVLSLHLNKDAKFFLLIFPFLTKPKKVLFCSLTSSKLFTICYYYTRCFNDLQMEVEFVRYDYLYLLQRDKFSIKYWFISLQFVFSCF